MITREIGWNSGLPHWLLIVMDIVLFLAIAGVVVYKLRKRTALWRIGKPDKRTDQLGRRIKSALTEGLFQRAVLKDRYPGILHAMLFFGFVVLFIGTSLLVVQEYIATPIFDWYFFQGNFYIVYSFLLDLFGLLALAAVVLFTVRRYVQKPARLDNQSEDSYALILLFLVLLSGFLVEGARLAVEGDDKPYEKWSFVGWVLGAVLPRSKPLHMILWWVHLALAVWFLVVIVGGKFIHIITSWANQFFRDLDEQSKGAIKPIPAEEFETAESFGIARLEDLTWKQIFDTDACTRCGRCQDACPAFNTRKPLSPKKLMQDIKIHWLEVAPALAAAKAKTSGDRQSASNGAEIERKAINGEVVLAEETWACTNCRACVEVCPVFIEHVDVITGLRQNLVMAEGQMPNELQDTLRKLETQGNPWGMGSHQRLDWAKGLEAPLIKDTSDTEILYFVGCAGAFADRNQKVAQSFVKVLKAAGVKFAVLGEEEQCCGDTARRAGNEYLFQMTARQNIELFKQYNIKTIVTTCPHGYHTFKKEYPAFEGKYEVYHHTEYLMELLEQGRLKIDASRIKQRLTYHDSCFLGRYNDVYEPARQVLRRLGGRLVEMEKTRHHSFCCGAGGARMWLEEEKDQRVNMVRTEQALATGAEGVVTACPYCLTMIQDGLDELKPEHKCRDVAELVEAALV
ncbi:MAG: hypothetical protein AMJ79_13795 [Phycisphaerae bacterium SM23_30]|nr:MAG: hypothetical protein AMJ79_13795 [Phycisphaerae bacterium SM23_30]